MKNAIIGTLVLMMLFLSACSTSDRGDSNDHTNIFESVENRQSLTGEDVALLLTELNDVDYAEALQIVEHELAQGITFYKASITHNFAVSSDGTKYGDWMVVINAVMKTSVDSNGVCYFVDADPLCSWSATSGAEDYTWLEIFPPIAAVVNNGSVYLSTRGSLIVPEPKSFGQDILEAKLGFEETYTSDGIQYYRKTQTISGTYTMEKTETIP